MSAKDCVPFLILGIFLAPIAFMLLTILKNPEILALILLLTSVTLSALFGRQKGVKFVLTASLITFTTSFVLSFLLLGFALRAEQHSILKVGKIENGTDCVYISENEMNKYPVLKRAVEIVERRERQN